MGVSGLKAAHDRGEPLVEVTVQFRPDVDAVTATERINADCEDFNLHARPWYDQPRVRVGSATRAALERLFGMQLKRVRLEKYDEGTGTWGHWPNAWRWEQVSDPDLGFSEVAQLIETICLSQPGQGDYCQPWD
jgi:DNA-binding transcriptional LysR family regulator